MLILVHDNFHPNATHFHFRLFVVFLGVIIVFVLL